MRSPLESEDDAAFKAALIAEDELGLVVRAHIHVEAKLVELLELLLVEPKQLTHLRLEYSERVHLAIACGLSPHFAGPLLMLGTLRNAFAHKLGAKLSKDRVDALYKSFSAEDKTLIHDTYEQTRSRQVTYKDMPKFGDAPAKQRFIVMVITLRGWLKAAILEVKPDAHA